MAHSDRSVSHAPLVSNLGSQIRLDYLDGVRALLAIYVSIFHASLCIFTPLRSGSEKIPALLCWIVPPFLGGYFAVGFFIVISGYCLMLPMARGGQLRLPGGMASFLGRRARRILPPYYAALLLSLLLLLSPGFNQPSGRWADVASPAWNTEVIVSHLLLIHNWSLEMYYRIDPPVWSIAVEAQIYVLFAVGLVPFARWVGVSAIAVFTLAGGLAAHWTYAGRFDHVYRSFIGLFALGMLGVTVNYSTAATARFCRERLPWGIFSALGWIAVVGLAARSGWALLQDSAWLVDPLIGWSAACLLIFCTRAKMACPPSATPPIVRSLENRWLVAVGGMSYSYYLIHVPLLYVLDLALRALKLPFLTYALWMYGLTVPICLSGAYLFHLAFERPFMPGRPRTADAAARAAVVSPAP